MFSNNPNMSLLSWNFKRPNSTDSKKVDAGYIPVRNDDVGFVLQTNFWGSNYTGASLEQSFLNEADMILKYRQLALQPAVDAAVNEIVNEAVSVDDVDGSPIELRLDNLMISDKIKDKIKDEFDYILNLLNFNDNGYDIFRKFYVDGRLGYYVVIDTDKPHEGIKELRYISPLSYKKIREEIKEITPKGIEVVKEIKEYFVFQSDLWREKQLASPSIPFKISNDSVCYITSGLIDEATNITYSFLQKSMKYANSLRMMEDATIIYRLSRSAERRVIYIDTGNLPKTRAEAYMKSVIQKLKNKTTYNIETGEMTDQRNIMSMQEDIFLPRRNGSNSTEITTLEGGQNLGVMTDVEYYKRQLYQSLNVPLGRIMVMDMAAGMFDIGRSTITREEISFHKFILRLRRKFSQLFKQALGKQLILKKVLTESEWCSFKEKIVFEYNTDSFFSELKELEIMRERVSMAESMDAMLGKYYTKQWIRTNILKQTEDDIEAMAGDMEAERKEQLQFDRENIQIQNNPFDEELGFGEGETTARPKPFQPKS